MKKITIGVSSKKTTSLWLYVVLPGALILIAVTAALWLLDSLEVNFFRTSYNNEVNESISLISRRIQNSLISAESIAAFFIGSENVSKLEFEEFASKIITQTKPLGLSLTLEWVDAQDDVQYIYPLDENNKKIIGLDLNQFPNRLIPITKARETRLPVITEPIMLGQGYPGILLYVPIYKGDEYLGSALSVIRLSELLAPLSETSHLYEYNENIKTEKFIIPVDKEVIYTLNGERIINPQGDTELDPEAKKYVSLKNEVSKDLALIDKTWQFRFDSSYRTQISKRMWIYTVTGYGFSILIIVLIYLVYKRQKQVSEEKTRFESLFAAVGEGLIASDKLGKITFINEAAERLSGYKKEEVIDKSYYDVIKVVDEKGEMVSPEQRFFYQALHNKAIISVNELSHLYILRKDGTRFALSSTIAPIIINSKVDGAIVVFQDVTKESEIDRMKTEFLSLASHQLLTPISAIKWISEMLLGGDFGKLNEKQKEYIGDITNSTKRMSELVNSLLNISRIESGRIVVKPEPTDLKILATEIIKEVENKSKIKNQTLEISVVKELPKINIDPRLIGEVYKNLLTNAIKYTPEKGKILVDISVNNNEIISKVIDNGYGIPEAEKEKVFKKFYRGENIVDIEKDGNGLGLYLVKQLIDVSGGKIGFESEINKGTTFWFSLPLSGSEKKSGEVSIT